MTEKSAWKTEPSFDLETVRQGMSKGKRHFAFKQYLGWLIKKGHTKEKAKEILLAWNELNRPPIPDVEISYYFELYWAMWCKLPEEDKGEDDSNE